MLLSNFTKIYVGNASYSVLNVSFGKENNFIIYPEIQSYLGGENVSIVLPDNLLLDEDNLPIQFNY